VGVAQVQFKHTWWTHNIPAAAASLLFYKEQEITGVLSFHKTLCLIIGMQKTMQSI